MPDVTSLNEALDGFTVVETLSFECEPGGNACRLRLELRRGDLDPGPDASPRISRRFGPRAAALWRRPNAGFVFARFRHSRAAARSPQLRGGRLGERCPVFQVSLIRGGVSIRRGSVNVARAVRPSHMRALGEVGPSACSLTRLPADSLCSPLNSISLGYMTDAVLKLNQIAQGFIPWADGVAWFAGLSECERAVVMRYLVQIAKQSHPRAEEIEPAIQLAGLKPTFTPCVLVKMASPAPERAFERVFALPENEREKSFKLLLALFSIADARRRQINCKDGCTHAWHNLPVPRALKVPRITY